MPKAPTLREASRPAYTRARENPPLGATPDLRGAWPSYLDLGAKLDDAVRRNSEELRRPCRDAREAGVQALARSCHPGAWAGFDVARLKSRAEQRIAATVKVVAIHAVGLDGFWIHRLLGANGIISRPQRPPTGVLGYGMQLCLTERASRFGLRSGQVVVALAESADAGRRSGRMGDHLARGAARGSLAHPPTAMKSYTPTPCTMRNLHAPSASPCT